MIPHVPYGAQTPRCLIVAGVAGWSCVLGPFQGLRMGNCTNWVLHLATSAAALVIRSKSAGCDPRSGQSSRPRRMWIHSANALCRLLSSAYTACTRANASSLDMCLVTGQAAKR